MYCTYAGEGTPPIRKDPIAFLTYVMISKLLCAAEAALQMQTLDVKTAVRKVAARGENREGVIR